MYFSFKYNLTSILTRFDRAAAYLLDLTNILSD